MDTDIYSVYILSVYGKGNLRYVGMTNNFARRIRQHNQYLKGGARYTRRCQGWYPVCIIDGFRNKREAMQCEWAVKHKNRRRKGVVGRVRAVYDLMNGSYWTSNSPSILSQNLRIYIDDEFEQYCPLEDALELWWRYDNN